MISQFHRATLLMLPTMFSVLRLDKIYTFENYPFSINLNP